jgi:hypothetical protein
MMFKRRPQLLRSVDWDVVRAAQHMMELHGARAAGVADERAERASNLASVRQWHAIAVTIRRLEEGDDADVDEPTRQQRGRAPCRAS